MRLSCEEAARLLSRQQDEALGTWQGLRLRWHLARCGDCTELQRQLVLLAAWARGEEDRDAQR